MDGLDKLAQTVGGSGGFGGAIPGISGGGGGIDDILKQILGGGGGGGGTSGSPLWMKLLTGGMFGAGEIGNIIEERKRAQYQNMLMDLIKNPAKLTQMVLSAQRPLDNALVQGTMNRVQGDMAQRGLSQAPGIFAASQSQALAPYIQENYGRAMEQVMRSLGLPGGTFEKPTDMSGSLMQFLRTFGSSGGGGGGNQVPHGSSPVPGFVQDWNLPDFMKGTNDFPSTQPGGG